MPDNGLKQTEQMEPMDVSVSGPFALVTIEDLPSIMVHTGRLDDYIGALTAMKESAFAEDESAEEGQ